MTTPVETVQSNVCQGCYVYWSFIDLWHTASLPAEKTSIARVQAAAANGCPCCRVIADAFDALTPVWQTKVKSQPIGMLWRLDSLAIQLRGANSPGWLTIYEHVDGPSFGRNARFAGRSEVLATSRAENAFRTANSWMTDCVNNHPACAQPFFSTLPTTTTAITANTAANSFVPTRLLDVDGNKGRIILVEDAPPGSPYVALSYCWGPDPSGTVMTKKNNVASHLDPRCGIELSILPKTIQDAVLVCRRLQVPYLWVDALCIVQDSGDDWRHESAQMCDIYQRSHITIAAHRASACQHGFLGEQTLGKNEYQSVFWTENIGTDGDTSRKKIKMILRTEDTQMLPLPTAPLDTRAWTLQEVILPRRILHFFEHEMAWECQSTHRCECGEKANLDGPHLPMLGLGLRSLDDDKKMLESGDVIGQRSVLAKLNWMTLVEQFSRRSLTRLSDKLIAMDGLARMVEGVTGGSPVSQLPPLSLDYTVIRPVYVEGLFVAAFAQQLMWTVSPNSLGVSTPLPSTPPQPTTRRLSTDLHAPSWSWASVDAPVSYSMIYSENAESLLRVHGFAPYPLVDGNTMVTGVRVTASVVPAAIRTMAPVDTTIGQHGPTRLHRPLISRSSIVRSLNGLSHGVFCDDVQAPNILLDSSELPCWVADDSVHNNRVRQQWLTRHASAPDTDTSNGLTRSCQHQRVNHIRHLVREDDGDATTTKSRWCDTCRVWPSDDVAWQNYDTNERHVASQTAAVPERYLLMKVLRRRENGSYCVYFLALQPSIKVPGAWERFGHGRCITWDKAAPYVDLFWGCKSRDLLVV